MAQVNYRGRGNRSLLVGAGPYSSITVAMPTVDIYPGDTLVALIRADSVGTAVGWTQVASEGDLVMLTRTATGAEPTTVQFSVSSASSVEGVIFALGNVDTIEPVHATASATGSGTSVAMPEITTGLDECLLVSAIDSDNDSTVEYPSGWVEQSDNNSRFATYTLATAQTLSADTVTLADSATEITNLVVAFQPQRDGTPTYKGTSGLENVSYAGGTITVQRPADTQPGDLLLLHIRTRASAKSDPILSQWTGDWQLVGQSVAVVGAGHVATFVLSKEASVWDTSSWTFVIDNIDLHRKSVSRFSGAHGEVPVAIAAAGTGDSFALPDLETVASTSLLAFFTSVYGSPTLDEVDGHHELYDNLMQAGLRYADGIDTYGGETASFSHDPFQWATVYVAITPPIVMLDDIEADDEFGEISLLSSGEDEIQIASIPSAEAFGDIERVTQSAQLDSIPSAEALGIFTVFDPNYVPGHDDPVPVQAGTSYTGAVFARTSAAGVTMKLALVAGGATLATGPERELGTNWRMLRCTWHTDLETAGIRLEAIKTSTPAAEIELTGWGLYQGGIGDGHFNSGARVDDENLTDYVLSFDSEAGTRDDITRMGPIDGRLRVTLRNDERLFSPRNADSQFYGRFKKRALTQLQGHNGVSWVTLWTGLLDKLSIEAGTRSNMQATLEANQGLVYLDNKRVEMEPGYDGTTTEIIRELMQEQTIPGERYAWKLDSHSRWGLNTFVSDPDVTLDADDTAYVHPLVGVNWKETTTVRSALDDMITNELGFAYYDREGRVAFRNRQNFIPSATENADAPIIDLDTEAQSAGYEDRGIQATEIEITYHPREAYAGLLWNTKSENRIKVAVGETNEMLVSPETAEGFKITPFTISPFGGGSTYAGYDPDEWARPSGLHVTTAIEGGQIKLTLTNATTSDIEFEIALTGTGYYTKDPQTVIVRSEPLFQENNGLAAPLRFDLNLVADEVEARSIARHLLNTLSNMRDGIFEVRYDFSEVDERLKKILGLSVGDVVLLNERQSFLEESPHLILSESFRLNGRHLTITHRMIPVQPIDIWRLDESEWGITTRVGY